MIEQNNTAMCTLTVNDEDVLRNLRVLVSLDDGSSLELDLDNVIEEQKESSCGSYSEKRCVFKDKQELVNMSLIFKQYKDIVFGYIEAKVTNKRVIHRHKHFALEGGILIKVKNAGSIDDLMALYRHKDWWTRPYFKKDLSTLPARTQSLLWREDNSFYYMTPVVDKVFKSDFNGNGDGMDIRVSSYVAGCDSCKSLVFAAAVGNDPFELSKKTIERTLEELGHPTFMREKKRYPEPLKYLGWCSWDAFYHAVNEKGLLEKAQELNEKNIPVKWVMIDDGWLDVKNERLMSFNANKEKFPGGLKSAAKNLKERHGINWVGVWHAFMGYWGGVNPEGELAKTMKEFLYSTNSNKLIPYPEASKGFGFWDAWYTELKKEGIDFVKVDGQSAVNNFLIHNEAVGKSARESHKALEAAVGIHFDNCIINCMGMALENIWNRPISSVSRNSDDFVPGEEISFKEHALQNSYNSYFHGNFYWGDWDMFWTNHNEDVQNSVLRAISGGPVYFSDRVGNTDPSTIFPLVMKDGKLLRGDRPGLPTIDSLFRNPNEEKVPLKVWNTVGESGIVAAFNINLQGEKVKGSVSPADLPYFKDGKYLIYDFFKKEIKTVDYADQYCFELDKDKVALFVIVPKKGDFTAVGLTDKYLAPATIGNIYVGDDMRVVTLAQGGQFSFVSERKVAKVKFGSKDVQIISKNNNLYVVDCSEFAEQVKIEITVE
jgi:raffinose synthase